MNLNEALSVLKNAGYIAKKANINEIQTAYKPGFDDNPIKTARNKELANIGNKIRTIVNTELDNMIDNGIISAKLKDRILDLYPTYAEYPEILKSSAAIGIDGKNYKKILNLIKKIITEI